jgi:hypothetical protein
MSFAAGLETAFPEPKPYHRLLVIRICVSDEAT